MPSDIEKISERNQVADEARHHYDSIVGSRGSIGAPYYYLMHSPDMAARTANLLGYARFESILPAHIKELAVCVTAREMDCVYEWAAHENDALEAGVSAEVVSAIRDRKQPNHLTHEESLIVDFVQQLLRSPHRVTEDTFKDTHALLGDAQLADLSGVIGAYVALACSLNAFDVQTPDGRPVLPN